MFAAFFLIFAFFLIEPKEALAENNYATIVNPVRISGYNNKPVDSLNAEYEVVKEFDLPATWLLNYDSLEMVKLAESVKNFNEKQEIGIFLEITENLCEDSNVIYNKNFSWHHPANVFLTGYKQSDRIKLIDTVIAKFASIYGYYPKSVGAWWIDSFSLNYIHEKYGVTANLGLSDQFATDGYQVWGTYWSTPYYPNSIHSGIPASTEKNKIDVVTLEWAPRDPLNGYISSLFSTQDYLVAGRNLNTSYFQKLVELYSFRHANKYGHITIGLEADLSKDAYKGEYRDQLSVINNLYNKGDIKVLNMKDFSEWYRGEFAGISPVQFIESDDLLGGDDKTFWYQSSKYRIGIKYNNKSNSISVFDLRIYPDNFEEPYYYSPNKDFFFFINIPSVIDNIGQKNEWEINLGEIVSIDYKDEMLLLKFVKGEMVFDSNGFVFKNGELKIPDYVSKNPLITYKRGGQTISIEARNTFETGAEGLSIKALKPEFKNFLKRKMIKVVLILSAILIILAAVNLIKSNLSFRKKLLLILLIIIPTWMEIARMIKNNSETYFVSLSEIDALSHLKLMDRGSVLVFDNVCLGCEWNSPLKPAVFENIRGYVGKYSNKRVIYNKSVFEAKNQTDARQEFNKTGTEYIYVARYENYNEKVPFSPGDLGIEKVYENANAQIWKRVNK